MRCVITRLISSSENNLKTLPNTADYPKTSENTRRVYFNFWSSSRSPRNFRPTSFFQSSYFFDGRDKSVYTLSIHIDQVRIFFRYQLVFFPDGKMYWLHRVTVCFRRRIFCCPVCVCVCDKNNKNQQKVTVVPPVVVCERKF